MNAPNTAKKKEIQMMIDYLRNDIKSGILEKEASESVEVAIDCLQTSYGLQKDSFDNDKNSANSFFGQFEKFLSNYEDSQEHENVASMLSQPDPAKRLLAEKLKEDGNAAMLRGDYKAGLEFYTKAIQLDNGNAAYYGNRAAAYIKLDQPHPAISDCNTALAIDPNYSKSYARLGMAYTALLNYKKAKYYYKKALELEPKNESYQNNVKVVDDMLNLAQPTNLPPPFNNPDLFSFAQEMFSDPSMNVLGRRLAEQLYPEIARQFGGGSGQDLLPPQSNEKKED